MPIIAILSLLLSAAGIFFLPLLPSVILFSTLFLVHLFAFWVHRSEFLKSFFRFLLIVLFPFFIKVFSNSGGHLWKALGISIYEEAFLSALLIFLHTVNLYFASLLIFGRILTLEKLKKSNLRGRIFEAFFESLLIFPVLLQELLKKKNGSLLKRIDRAYESALSDSVSGENGGQ